MFGEDDPDQDVSPDSADPEAVGNAAETALNTEAEKDGNIKRVSTRQWAQENDYDPEKLFNKFFQDDIKYLLSKGKLCVNIHGKQSFWILVEENMNSCIFWTYL